MPPLDEVLEKHLSLRVLAYGPPKVKKTWWAALAAEFGYNVLLLDGDNGAHILRNIKPAARKRITVVPIWDDFSRPIMAEFMVRFLRGGTFVWNEDKREAGIPNARHEYKYNASLFQPTKCTSNDVIIVDSNTALVTSLVLRFAKENNIDLSEADRTDWEGYGYTGRLMDWFFAQMDALPCHVIIIAHQEAWEKKKQWKDSNGKIQQETLFTRLQPRSTSGPAGQKLAQHFSDILYFYMQGTAYKISTEAHADRDGGSRLMPPKIWDWSDLTFAMMIKNLGQPLPASDAPLSEGWKYLPIGSTVSAAVEPNNENEKPEATEKPEPLQGDAKPVAVSIGTPQQTASFKGLFKK